MDAAFRSLGPRGLAVVEDLLFVELTVVELPVVVAVVVEEPVVVPVEVGVVGAMEVVDALELPSLGVEVASGVTGSAVEDMRIGVAGRE